jgi:pyruvate,orthophosphate dikinase
LAAEGRTHRRPLGDQRRAEAPGAAAADQVLDGAEHPLLALDRALGRPCVVGVGPGGTSGWLGQEVTVDATKGVVYAGRLPTEAVRVEDDPALSKLFQWARETSPVQVDEEPGEDTLDLDAAGIGLAAGETPDTARIAEALDGSRSARGAVLASAAGADAVLHAGVRTVVTSAGQSPLALLLHLVHADARRRGGAS